jgi:hypothetical protein
MVARFSIFAVALAIKKTSSYLHSFTLLLHSWL